MVHSLHSLLVSCEEGEAAKVRTILQSGEVGVNSADEAEISGLQVAAANGHIEIVSELLARGANTEHQNSSGWTALQQAACHGHTSVVARLLGAGAKVAHRNRQGRAPSYSLLVVLAPSPGLPWSRPGTHHESLLGHYYKLQDRPKDTKCPIFNRN